MVVADGDTIFVGGLIKNRIDESKRGIPVIGRIPGIGRLFSNRQKTISNTETIVLITPTVVRSAAADEATRSKIQRLEQDQNESMQILDQEMELFFGSGKSHK
jgi:general secretion pathway protein D